MEVSPFMVGYHTGQVLTMALFFIGLYALFRLVIELISEEVKDSEKFKRYVALASAITIPLLWFLTVYVGPAVIFTLIVLGVCYLAYLLYLAYAKRKAKKVVTQ